HRVIHGHRDVPGHGDDVLAPADGGGAGAGGRSATRGLRGATAERTVCPLAMRTLLTRTSWSVGVPRFSQSCGVRWLVSGEPARGLPMASPQWRFDAFHLDPDNACLWRGMQPIALTPKAFDVLHYLVTHTDRLVSKDELLDAVWPETAVSDVVVRIAIGELRRALGDTAQVSRYIATVQRRGCRFLAPVVEYTAAGPSPKGGP